MLLHLREDSRNTYTLVQLFEIFVANVAGTSSTYNYYMSDLRYSNYGMIDSSGAVVDRFRYDGYGAQTIMDSSYTVVGTESVNQSYGYTGRRLDAESGLQYYRARYFDNEQGRFINRDPIGYKDGLNLYRGYFVNNGLDPLGLSIAPFGETEVRDYTDSSVVAGLTSFELQNQIWTAQKDGKLAETEPENIFSDAITLECKKGEGLIRHGENRAIISLYQTEEQAGDPINPANDPTWSVLDHEYVHAEILERNWNNLAEEINNFDLPCFCCCEEAVLMLKSLILVHSTKAMVENDQFHVETYGPNGDDHVPGRDLSEYTAELESSEFHHQNAVDVYEFFKTDYEECLNKNSDECNGE